jgi:hypothetical protein
MNHTRTSIMDAARRTWIVVSDEPGVLVLRRRTFTGARHQLVIRFGLFGVRAEHEYGDGKISHLRGPDVLRSIRIWGKS